MSDLTDDTTHTRNSSSTSQVSNNKLDSQNKTSLREELARISIMSYEGSVRYSFSTDTEVSALSSPVRQAVLGTVSVQ